MFVRQLIGREAGTIQDQPYHAATSNLAAGTVERVTDAELAAAGLSTAPGPSDSAPEAFPKGYLGKADEVSGFNVFGPNGSQLNERPFPNLAAARSYAQADFAANQGPDLGTLTFAQLKEFAAEKNIDLGAAKTKQEILAVIKAALEAPAKTPVLRMVDVADGLFNVLGADDAKVNAEPLTREAAEALVAKGQA
jgi:hypothetical protein